MTVAPLSDNRYSTPVSFSFCTTPAASSGAIDVYSGTEIAFVLPVDEADHAGDHRERGRNDRNALLDGEALR